MWLTLIILSYFLFSLASFLDKYILGGEFLSPKLYSFYVGILSFAVLFIVPIGILFSHKFFYRFGFCFLAETKFFLIPSPAMIAFSLFTGITALIALFFYYKAVNDFEVSRIGPAVGGTVPIFSLLLIYLFSFLPINLNFGKLDLGVSEILAMFFLVLGSLVLTIQKEKLATFKGLKAALIASFLFGFNFILTKIVYIFLPFLPGFIWMCLGNFLGALCFLIFAEVRNNIFKPQTILKKKIVLPFAFSKAAGALASFLQNRAVFLAPVILLPVINALAGIQYVFLIVLATLFFFKFPEIFKEQVSKNILLQKIAGIFLIITGLIILT